MLTGYMVNICIVIRIHRYDTTLERHSLAVLLIGAPHKPHCIDIVLQRQLRPVVVCN
jgi:hypothetical protein